MSEQELLNRITRLEKQLELLHHANGFVQTPGLMQLYESLYVQGELKVDGPLTGGSHNHSYLSRYSASGLGVGYAGQMEPCLGNLGGGAAAIGLQRQGVYGMNFGLDTDNQLKIGGWSMGDGKTYRIRHDANQQGMQVHNTNNWGITNGGWTTINWTTWDYQTPASLGNVFIRNGNGYNVPDTGWYAWMLALTIGGMPAGGAWVDCGLQVNAVWMAVHSYWLILGHPYITFSGISYATAGNKIEPMVTCNANGLNGTFAYNYGNYFTVQKVY